MNAYFDAWDALTIMDQTQIDLYYMKRSTKRGHQEEE